MFGQRPNNTGSPVVEGNPLEFIFSQQYAFGERILPVDDSPGTIDSSTSITGEAPPDWGTDHKEPTGAALASRAAQAPGADAITIWTTWPDQTVPLQIRLPGGHDINTLYFPSYGAFASITGLIQCYAGETPSGQPFFQTNGATTPNGKSVFLGDCIPVPSGVKVVTLTSTFASGFNVGPFQIMASAIRYSPFPSSGPPSAVGRIGAIVGYKTTAAPPRAIYGSEIFGSYYDAFFAYNTSTYVRPSPFDGTFSFTAKRSNAGCAILVTWSPDAYDPPDFLHAGFSRFGDAFDTNTQLHVRAYALPYTGSPTFANLSGNFTSPRAWGYVMCARHFNARGDRPGGFDTSTLALVLQPSETLVPRSLIWYSDANEGPAPLVRPRVQGHPEYGTTTIGYSGGTYYNGLYVRHTDPFGNNAPDSLFLAAQIEYTSGYIGENTRLGPPTPGAYDPGGAPTNQTTPPFYGYADPRAIDKSVKNPCQFLDTNQPMGGMPFYVSDFGRSYQWRTQSTQAGGAGAEITGANDDYESALVRTRGQANFSALTYFVVDGERPVGPKLETGVDCFGFIPPSYPANSQLIDSFFAPHAFTGAWVVVGQAFG